MLIVNFSGLPLSDTYFVSPAVTLVFEVSSDSTGSLGAGSYPLSYVYSGLYYWGTGRLYQQTLYGYYWSSTIYDSSNSYDLTMYGSRLIKAHTYNKRCGFALRCQIDILSLIDAAHGTTKILITKTLRISMATSVHS